MSRTVPYGHLRVGYRYGYLDCIMNIVDDSVIVILMMNIVFKVIDKLLIFFIVAFHLIRVIGKSAAYFDCKPQSD